MNLINTISFRYLFGKKSSQAINWITGVSVVGISVGTAALIIQLSVFNGFEELTLGLLSKYNSDIKIVLKEGKTFVEDSSKNASIYQIKGVQNVSRTLEEVAMFQYGSANEFGILKGVDLEFNKVCSVKDAVIEGTFEIRNEGIPLANLDLAIRNKLGVSIMNVKNSLKVFVPDHEDNVNPSSALRKYTFKTQSVYSFNPGDNSNIVITDLHAVRQILKKQGELSSIEIKLNDGASIQNIKAELIKIMGDKFLVKDRYQQDEAFLKIMRLEKWLYYALFCLTLVLVSFTVVGALWMIVLEKRMDISILKSMGMTNQSLKRVFIQLGLMICFLGLILGSCVGLSFYALQKEFGLIGVPKEFIMDSYPIEIRWTDFLLVGMTVLIIGTIASFLPTKKITEVLPMFREE